MRNLRNRGVAAGVLLEGSPPNGSGLCSHRMNELVAATLSEGVGSSTLPVDGTRVGKGR
jgi:hypothetical protein